MNSKTGYFPQLGSNCSINVDSYLPNELWLEIFAYATYCPAETSLALWTSSSDILEIGRASAYLAYRDAKLRQVRGQLDYKTRRSLTLVSRRWRELAIPVLYGCIILTNGDQLQNVAGLLRQKEPLRQLVKFLHIAYSLTDEPATKPPNIRPDISETLDIIRKLYQNCHNLMVATGNTNLGSVGRLSGSEYPKKLRYLVISNTQSSIFTTQPPTLFDCLSSFRMLRFLVLCISAGTITSRTPKFSLPHLEVLALIGTWDYDKDVDEYLSAAELPKLHALQLFLIQYNHYNRPRIHRLEPFKKLIERFGSQMTTFKIDDNSSRSSEIVIPLSFPIHQYLPNLQQLVLNFYVHASIFVDLSRCLKIRILEIRGIREQNERHPLFNDTIIEHYVNLRILRLCGGCASTFRGMQSFLVGYREFFEKRGVSLETRIDLDTI
jgi:hypothetical protein